MSSYPVTWITNSLAVGRAPMSYSELDFIKSQGINAIINLCAEFSDLHELEESSGFEVYYLPIWDEDVPKVDAMEKALHWLDEAIYLGKKVLVHCRHGMGRTGTIVTAYIIRKGHSLKQASKTLKVSAAEPSNYGQWKLVKKYGKKSGVLKIREPSLEIKNRVDLGLYFSDYETLIKQIDQAVENQPEQPENRCGEMDHECCVQPFHIQLIEVVYLHSKINRHFTSANRQALIDRAIETYRTNNNACPFNTGSGCQAMEIRPARCRIFGAAHFSKDRDEIEHQLTELSQSLFLAFSGKFQPDMDFSFTIADTLSGKFVQKCFHYMSSIEKNNQISSKA